MHWLPTEKLVRGHGRPDEPQTQVWLRPVCQSCLSGVSPCGFRYSNVTNAQRPTPRRSRSVNDPVTISRELVDTLPTVSLSAASGISFYCCWTGYCGTRRRCSDEIDAAIGQGDGVKMVGMQMVCFIVEETCTVGVARVPESNGWLPSVRCVHAID